MATPSPLPDAGLNRRGAVSADGTLAGGVKIDASLVRVAHAQTLSANSNTVAIAGARVHLSGASDFVLTSTPTIAAGATVGQEVTIANTGTKLVTLQGAALTGSALKMRSREVTLAPSCSITVVWDGAAWNEIHRATYGTADRLNVADFGAVGDSTNGVNGTDDTLAIQKAFDAALALSKPLDFQNRRIYRTAAELTIGDIVIDGKKSIIWNGTTPDRSVLLCDAGEISNLELWGGDIVNYGALVIDTVRMRNVRCYEAKIDGVYLAAGLAGRLDLATVTTHVDTKIEHRRNGAGTNTNVTFVGDSGSGIGVTFTETFNGATTVHFEPGVTTVTLLEAAITAWSINLKVRKAGTGSRVLTTPADAFGPTALTGGASANNDNSTFKDCRFELGGYLYRTSGFPAMASGCTRVTCAGTASTSIAATWELRYDNQTGNFTAGQILTGGTSGATGLIASVSDQGTTGTITISTLPGASFVDDEIITDPLGGHALALGGQIPSAQLIHGTGTNWLTSLKDARPGDLFWIGATATQILMIRSVDSDTRITLQQYCYANATRSGQEWQIGIGDGYHEEPFNDNNLCKLDNCLARNNAGSGYAYNGLFGSISHGSQADGNVAYIATVGQPEGAAPSGTLFRKFYGELNNGNAALLIAHANGITIDGLDGGSLADFAIYNPSLVFGTICNSLLNSGSVILPIGYPLNYIPITRIAANAISTGSILGQDYAQSGDGYVPGNGAFYMRDSQNPAVKITSGQHDASNASCIAFDTHDVMVTAGCKLISWRNHAVEKAALFYDGTFGMLNTDATGSPGAATINKPTGRAAIALGASTVVITNSTVSAADTVLLTELGRDATCIGLVVDSVSSGSFQVSGSANATAATKFMFSVIKAI